MRAGGGQARELGEVGKLLLEQNATQRRRTVGRRRKGPNTPVGKGSGVRYRHLWDGLMGWMDGHVGVGVESHTVL